MEGIADVMADAGSFYPSIHLAWHFEEVDFEVARPVYMMAQPVQDWFKGGWSATWESTAGPQLFTGGKGLYKPAEWQVPGCTIDADTMCQIMLTWIAAGFRGFGLWCANPRTAGWEAGEYGLYDSDNQPTARAEVAGRIGSACRTYRDELWDCHKEPEVGVYMDWTADAFWAAVAVGSRDLFAHMPTLARVGAGRMLLNHNIPFEFVTGKDLHEGLADRYKVIYLPAIIALDADLLPVLTSYARQGGHVIIDTPTAWLDIQGRIMETSVGSLFENLFGARMANIQYARPLNKPWKLDGHLMEGMTADLVPTTAHVTRRFDDGKVAVTEHFVGKGSASIIAFAAAVSCHKPNNGFVESFMANHFMKHLSLPFSCEGVLAYRLCGNGVRHYFLVNDGESRHVKLNADETYKQVTDVLSGEQVDIAQTLAVDRYGARWLRAER